MMAGFEMYTSETLSWLMDAVAYQDNKYNLNAGLRIYASSTSHFNLSLMNLLSLARDDTKQVNERGQRVDAHPFMVTIGMTITNFL
jgi:hypothetical protein